MKQYIKKALWIIPFVFSLNLSAQTYYFVGGAGTPVSTDGSDLANWNSSAAASPSTTTGRPSDFSVGTFDLNASFVDVNGMIVGNITFDDINQSGTLYNTGTLECNSISSFSLNTRIGNNLLFQDGTIHFSATSTASAQIIPGFPYRRLKLSGADKICIAANGLQIDSVLELGNCTFYISKSVIYGTDMNFENSSNGTIVYDPNSATTTAFSLTDSRVSGSRVFPGTVIFKTFRTTSGRTITTDEFKNLVISAEVTLGNNLTVTGDLTMNNHTITAGTTLNSRINLDKYQLQLNGTLNGNNILFAGKAVTSTDKPSLKFTKSGGQIGTIKFVQTSSATKTLSTLELINGATLTLGSNCEITNLVIDKSFLEIKNNTLLLKGVPTFTYAQNGTTNVYEGCLIGSSESNLTCSTGTTGTIYFDQRYESSRTIKNLTLQGNSAVTLGNWLNISGGTSTSSFGVVDVASSCTLNTGGYLTLKSNQYGTAMIGNIAGTLRENSTNGNSNNTIQIETYLPGSSSKGRRYRFLASPVVNGKFHQWRDSVSGSSSAPSTNFPYSSVRSGKGIQITGASPTSPTENFDESTTNNPSVFTYNENNAGSATGIGNSQSNEDAGWTAITDGLGTITNGAGYRVLVRGDRSITLKSANTVTPNNTTIQVRGQYVTGDKSITIYNSGSNTNNGINLIGNPFPCAIDWNSIHNNASTSNVDPAYVVWDPNTSTYLSWSKTSNTGDATRYISPGQGFLVYCTNTGGTKSSPKTGTVYIAQTAKTTSNGIGGWFFSEKKTNHLVAKLWRDTFSYERTYIYFLKGATSYYDSFDAGHIQNDRVNLSSIDSTNTLYKINCMDSLIGQRIVPLSLSGSPIGTYKMSFDDVITFQNHDLYLVDNYLKKTTKIDDLTNYDVTINSDINSYADGRFFINFEPKAVSSVVKIQKTDIFKIGSNPVGNVISISSNKNINGSVSFDILNMNGQCIYNGELETLNETINTNSLVSGMYILVLKYNNESQTIKFLK